MFAPELRPVPPRGVGGCVRFVAYAVQQMYVIIKFMKRAVRL